MKAKGKVRGFGLLELLISTAILAIIGGTVAETLGTMGQAASTGRAKQRAQKMAEHAMSKILNDLRMSGAVSVGGKIYPYIFDDGNALNVAGVGDFTAHAHAAAVHKAVAGEADAGVTREIVFVLPADADNNGVMDTDAAGNLVYPNTEYSYVLVNYDGVTNRLERRIGANAASAETIATNVERIAFETNAEDPAIPLDAVRVRIFFRLQDKENRAVPYRAETTIKLRNG